MASRLTTRAKLLVPALPLVVGLAIGTWLAMVTLSWGNAFVIWQLLWWSIVSIVIGLFTARAARVIPPTIPSNSSDENLHRLSAIIGLSYAGGAIALLAGLATSIWAMVAGDVAAAPVELYWPLPIAAFFLAVPGPARSKFDQIEDERVRANRESQRKKHCSELPPEQKAEYDAKFLIALYSLVRDDKTKRVSLPQVTVKLNHVCTPELLSAAVQMWENRHFIAATKDSLTHEYYVTLLDAGYYTCVRAKEVGMEKALGQHEYCLRLSDQDKIAYQKQLFMAIGKLARQRLPASGWKTFMPARSHQDEKSVAMDTLRSVQKHPCWPELIDSALTALTKLGLIEVKKTPESQTRSSGLGIFGYYQPDNKPDHGPQVVLTAKGQAIYSDKGPADSLEIAVNRYEEQQRIERERQQRCREITSLQRKEFEEQFLHELYVVAAGDVRPVMLRDVWSQLNHECTRELTGHALKIWRELKCINIESMYLHKDGEDEADVQIYITEHMNLSLTALGRDLCMLAITLGSMPQARKELLEGSRVKKEYNEYIMGDVFKNIGAGATIVNRSNLVNAMNATKDTVGPDVSEALRQLAEFIERSGDSDAAENFNAFTEELQQPNPRKSLLKSFWNGMLAALPTIADLATVVGTITALIA